MKQIFSAIIILLFAGFSQAQSMGSLQVNGQAGKYQIFQKVKAVRCTPGKRGECDPAIFFDLNKVQAVPAGSYLVGFENSIYPNVVTVDAGQTVTLNLQTVKVPSQVRGQKIKVFRDFSSLVEQKKIMTTMFMMNRHFFRLDDQNFGDLYLTGAWERDVVQRFTYETCNKIESFMVSDDDALSLCKTWKTASEPSGLKDFYIFADDGTFIEKWITFPGDIIPSKHSRYLVSAPMGEQDVVAVFPGAYKFQGEGKNAPVINVTVGLK
ncbi:MAG: hypothetical protein ACXVCP_09880 [Bdellovibrio sp.]